MRELTRGATAAARRLAPLAPLAGLALLGGCYTFAAAAPGAVPPGARVRVALTEPGASALAPAVGASVTGVEGSLLRTGGDTVVVRADRLFTTAGVDVQWAGGALNIPGPWRRGVDRRRLAAGRTAALVAGGVALSAGLIAIVRSGGGAEGEAGGGDPIRVFRGLP